MKRIFLIMVSVCSLLLADFSRIGEVVTDNNTLLQWQDNNVTIKRSWIDAIDYCESLILDGYDDWRLPNINELYFLADRSKQSPALDATFQFVIDEGTYWSSTTKEKGSRDSVWCVYLKYGTDTTESKRDQDYVRCVRGGDN